MRERAGAAPGRPTGDLVPGNGDDVELVDEEGRPVGVAPKLDAHRAPGRLHRAFSVFVFTTDGRVVLQRRSAGKYHFAGRWSNTCCSHQTPGESTVSAASRRLVAEMGLVCEPREVGTIRYEARDDVTGLVERELDHVLVATSDAAPDPDPAEVAEVRLVGVPVLLADISARPAIYTPWLAEATTVATAAWRSPPG